MRLNRVPRRGTTVVECALVYPLVFMFCLGLVVGAMGVFRYQELSSLSRRGARYASVHGLQYSKDTGNPAATPADVFNNAILPYATGMDTTQLGYNVTWNQSNAPTQGVLVNGKLVPTRNTVSVTVTYRWVPEAFFGGVTLSSTSTMPMCN